MRIPSVQASLGEKTHEAILISSPTNIFYLTGFGDPLAREREAWMLITRKNAYFFTDGRYVDASLMKQLSDQEIEFRLLTHEYTVSWYLIEISKSEHIVTITFEPDDLTVAEYDRLKSNGIALKSRSSGSSEISREISRMVKDETEIKFIKQACKLVDELLARVISQIKVGMRERDILGMLHVSCYMVHGSVIDLAFSPIVAIDENSAIPHYDTKTHGEKIAKKGSLILLDCGVRYKNYCSDITRIVSIGEPTSKITQAYDTLYKAQQRAIKDLSTLKTYKIVDARCRKQLTKAGYPAYTHATGHGIGIEVHELPRFSLVSPDTIKPGHVVTVEPGIYMPGHWGMRLEDTVAINQDGSTTILTTTNRDLIIV